MNFIRCLNLVSNNTKLNQINEDKIETNKKQDLSKCKSCFLSIHYSFNPVELDCKLGSFLILGFGIPVKNRVLLVQWKKLGEFVLSL